MSGALNRAIRIVTRRHPNGAGEARAVVEDDYHHFRVAIIHDGTRITATCADSGRQPFSLCSAAGERLTELVGMPLSPDMTAAFRLTDARLQCTHQFDLAALAIANAARGTSQRRYHVVVPDTDGERKSAILSRDGVAILQWSLEGTTITAPAPFTGQTIGAGFTDWVVKSMSLDEAEAALVMRRAVFISGGRNLRRNEIPNHAPSNGGCWVQQPERNELALRSPGSKHDFTGRPEVLTAGDETWLSFADAAFRNDEQLEHQTSGEIQHG